MSSKPAVPKGAKATGNRRGLGRGRGGSVVAEEEEAPMPLGMRRRRGRGNGAAGMSERVVHPLVYLQQTKQKVLIIK